MTFPLCTIYDTSRPTTCHDSVGRRTTVSRPTVTFCHVFVHDINILTSIGCLNNLINHRSISKAFFGITSPPVVCTWRKGWTVWQAKGYRASRWDSLYCTHTAPNSSIQRPIIRFPASFEHSLRESHVFPVDGSSTWKLRESRDALLPTILLRVEHLAYCMQDGLRVEIETRNADIRVRTRTSRASTSRAPTPTKPSTSLF